MIDKTPMVPERYNIIVSPTHPGVEIRFTLAPDLAESRRILAEQAKRQQEYMQAAEGFVSLFRNRRAGALVGLGITAVGVGVGVGVVLESTVGLGLVVAGVISAASGVFLESRTPKNPPQP